MLQKINMNELKTSTDTSEKWYSEAKAILKAELARKDVSYKRLSVLLEEIGVFESTSAITSKMARGTFSFAFFLQCMKAIGRHHAQIDIKDL
jgi:hypothetical protein